MSKTTSSGAGGRSSRTTGLTRMFSKVVARLKSRGEIPSEAELFRAMETSLEEVLAEHGHQPAPVRLRRSDRGEKQTLSSIYISPSTRENSTVSQAKQNFDGKEHRRQVDLALGLAPKESDIKKGIGVWEDGAKEFTMIPTEPHKARKGAAILGWHHGQKQVLIFTPGRGDSVRYRVTYPATSVDRAIDVFRDAGVPFHIHFPGKIPGTVSETHVVGDKDMAPRIAEVPKRLGGKVEQDEGTTEFIGHDSDRKLAAKAFQEILAARE